MNCDRRINLFPVYMYARVHLSPGFFGWKIKKDILILLFLWLSLFLLHVVDVNKCAKRSYQLLLNAFSICTHNFAQCCFQVSIKCFEQRYVFLHSLFLLNLILKFSTYMTDLYFFMFFFFLFKITKQLPTLPPGIS